MHHHHTKNNPYSINVKMHKKVLKLRFYVNLGHLYPIDLAQKCWGNLVDFNETLNVAIIPSVPPPSHNVYTTQNMASDFHPHTL
jgi:hypothetical protein